MLMVCVLYFVIVVCGSRFGATHTPIEVAHSLRIGEYERQMLAIFACGVRGLHFGVWGLAFEFWYLGLAFGVQGLGFVYIVGFSNLPPSSTRAREGTAIEGRWRRSYMSVGVIWRLGFGVWGLGAGFEPLVVANENRRHSSRAI